ncbi:hypothetical protein BJY04DRAFT_223486 [Aspergillus karnatakaensis]|uniref:uncharacterized protein n=1 Tax=Aspergillus karnatakaensis TaxID=1810916 RepID=UPI003CCCF3FD
MKRAHSTNRCSEHQKKKRKKKKKNKKQKNDSAAENNSPKKNNSVVQNNNANQNKSAKRQRHKSPEVNPPDEFAPWFYRLKEILSDEDRDPESEDFDEDLSVSGEDDYDPAASDYDLDPAKMYKGPDATLYYDLNE